MAILRDLVFIVVAFLVLGFFLRGSNTREVDMGGRPLDDN